jgi:transposase
VPALPPYVIEPIWQQFSTLLPEREVDHPLGCHRPRIPERVVFEKLLQVMVFGCAYHRIADEECSATTLRDPRDEWIEIGAMDALREIVLEAYDRYIDLELSEVAVDCCITKAPCGGEKAGASPVDRGKQGLKRSTMVDGEGIPLGTLAAPANPTTRHCCPKPSRRWTRPSEGCPRGRTSISTADMTRRPPASASMSVGLKPRSPRKASRHRSGLASGGWWRGRVRGTTPTRNSCGVRSGCGE